MNLVVQKREKFGKSVGALRDSGFIPAEVYGHGFKNQHVTVLEKDFLKIFGEAGESTIVNLVLGSEEWPVLIYAAQRDPLNGRFAHIDFYRVKMDEKIITHVPLEFFGEASAVKEQGAVINKAMTEIEVEALPADLPHRIQVDLGLLKNLDDSVYARDLRIPDKVKLLIEPMTVVVTAMPPQKEEEVQASADVSAVKVETEEKKVERAQEKEKSNEKAN